MKLYVARHGETEWNRLNKVCGRTDSHLTDKGLQQAQLLDIAADGGLGDDNAHIAQARSQILLRFDVVMLDNT